LISPEAKQLQAAIEALDGQRSLLGEAVFESAVAPLRARLSALLAAEPPGDAPTSGAALKQVTVLFVDMVGSTELSRGLDPEDVGAIVDDALSRFSSIVRKHGGKVLNSAGDSVMAAFGADVVEEDEAERAVRCGLALLGEGRSIAAEVRERHSHAAFDVRIGIHTGDVLLSHGTDVTASISGHTVNVAARMEQTAPPGALRISDATYGHVRGLFDVEAQPPLSVKGVSDPMATYLVNRAKPRAFRVPSRGVEGVDTRMIGRDAELDVLRSAFERLVGPEADLATVFIVGEAGLGKSRLLHEFQDWTRAQGGDHQLFEARATPQTLNQPYGLLRDLFAGRLRILDDDSMEVAARKLEEFIVPLASVGGDADDAQAQAHLLGQMIGIDFSSSRHVAGIKDDARQIRSRGFHAAAHAFRRLSMLAPIVLMLEDLHWADEASLDFIDYLAKTDRDVPMLIIASTRNTLFERRERLAEPHALVQLVPLDAAQSSALADELLKRIDRTPAALHALVSHRADGNPFYMEELVRMLIDSKAIRIDTEAWHVDPAGVLPTSVPSTLAGIIEARLDHLPQRERPAIESASVIGVRFWDKAVAFIEPHADEALPSLAQRELIEAREPRDTDPAPADAREYGFRHQILHQVTYDTILKSRRRGAHAKAAEWFAKGTGARVNDFLGVAAEHYEKAGDTRNACEYFIRAAERAAATFANEASLAYVARGLALTTADDARMRWRLLASRERTLNLQGRRAEQRADLDALRQLAEFLDDDSLRGEVAWRFSDMAVRTGDEVASENEARRALLIAEQQGNEDLALRAKVRLSNALAQQSQPLVGEAIAREGRARARDLGLKRLELLFVNSLGICSELSGNLGQQLACLLEGLVLSRELGDRRIEAVEESNAGLIFFKLGDDVEAASHLEAGLRLARVLGIRETEGHALCSMSEVSLRRGPAGEACDYAQAAVRIAIEVGSRPNEAFALHALGNAEVALGHWETAEEHFRETERLAREISYAPAVLDAIDGLTRLALAQGAIDRASQELDRLWEYARARDETAGGRGGWLAGSSEHSIRLTTYKVRARSGDSRADAALADAYTALQSEADAISDESWRRSFLENVPEHREISALWAAARDEQADDRSTA
jgi:class 3 adenylate cyclase/tetratricopeptide (TPR) repeat protein